MSYVNIHSSDGLDAFKKQLEIASLREVSSGNLNVEDILGMEEAEGLAAFRLIRFHHTNGLPQCPHCQSTESYSLTKRSLVWKCAHCGHQYTVTSGTMLHGRKMGMRSYLCLLSMMLNKDQFRSLLQFSNETKIGYKTAWTQINRFRSSMQAEGGCTVPFSLLERQAFLARWENTRSNLKRFLSRPKDSFYPHLRETSGPSDEGRELLEFVNKVTPRWMPDYMRADICQDMIVAVLAGEATQEELRASGGREFLAKVFEQYPWKYKWMSLDAPLQDGEDRTLHDVVSQEDYEERMDRGRPEARPFLTGVRAGNNVLAM